MITNLESNVLKNSQAWLFTQSRLVKVSVTPEFLTGSLVFPINDVIYNILIDNNNIMYISGKKYLHKYSLGNYPQSKNYFFEEDAKKFNPNQDIILASSENDILSVQTYNGVVVIREKDTLDQIKLIKNIDSPIKAIWSSYHSAYLVLGTNSIWKINRTITDLIFSADGYSIKDFSVNDYGQICVLFSFGNDIQSERKDFIKIIDSDFYKNLFLSFYDYQSIKKVTTAGKYFYIIRQNPPVKENYSGDAIIIDIKSNYINTIPIKAIVLKKQNKAIQSDGNTIQITSPSSGDTLVVGQEYDIEWTTTTSEGSRAALDLVKKDSITPISSVVLNTRKYKWKVPSDLELANDYIIRMSYNVGGIGGQPGTNFVFETGNFAISNVEPVPQTVNSSDYITGITYDSFTNNVIITFYSGLVAKHDLNTNIFYGLYDSSVIGIEGCAAHNDQLKQFKEASKVRIFVGTNKYLNNKWDSGVVDTKMTSMYYGGGNNLVPGEKYYVHIQVFFEEYGWSEIQIKEFIMPL